MTSETEVDKAVEGLLKLDPRPEKIVLFGSKAIDIEDQYSDIDLLVIQKTDLPFVERGKKAALLCPFSNVDVLVYTPKEVKESPFVQKALMQGKVLYEGSRQQIEKKIAETGVWWSRELWAKEGILQGIASSEFSTVFECLSEVFPAEWVKEQTEKTPKSTTMSGEVIGLDLRTAPPIVQWTIGKGSYCFLNLLSLGKQIQKLKEQNIFSKTMENRFRKNCAGIYAETSLLSYLVDKYPITLLEENNDANEPKARTPEFFIPLNGGKVYFEIKTMRLLSHTDEFKQIRYYFWSRREELWNVSGQMIAKFIFVPSKIVRVLRGDFKGNIQALFDDVLCRIKELYEAKDYTEKYYRNDSIRIQLLLPKEWSKCNNIPELFSAEYEVTQWRKTISRPLQKKVGGKFKEENLNFLIFFTDQVLSKKEMGNRLLKRFKERFYVNGLFFISSFMAEEEKKWGRFNEIEFIPTSENDSRLERHPLVEYICSYKKIV